MSHEKAVKLQKWAWVAFVALFMAGCGLGGPAHREPSNDVNAVIDMGFSIFEPNRLTIHKGDTVEWRNTSLISHTVTDLPGKAPQMSELPRGALPFNSGKIQAGGIYKHTFTVAGTYRYYCEFHAHHGMMGTVLVSP